MAQSRIGLRASAARHVEHIRAAPCGALFPLTPALSLGELGERVHHSLRGEQSRVLSFPLRAARCFLSLGERIKVRGNSANHPLGIGLPGTIKRTSPPADPEVS